MLAFRSEAHATRWCELCGFERGVVFSLAQLWRLAHAWYHDRLDPGWQRPAPAAAQELLSSLGFQGEFWRLG